MKVVRKETLRLHVLTVAGLQGVIQSIIQRVKK
jgi:hypothetical protein